jgi:antitoxin VapB
MERRVAINITNREADALIRRFAKIEGVTLTEAVVIAMREAIERRRRRETPRQTAARLRAEFGVELTDQPKSGS